MAQWPGIIEAYRDLLPVTATLGGQAANVQFVTGSYAQTPGVIQVFIRVPAGVTGPAVPVVVTIGGVSSQTGVTVAVQ